MGKKPAVKRVAVVLVSVLLAAQATWAEAAIHEFILFDPFNTRNDYAFVDVSSESVSQATVQVAGQVLPAVTLGAESLVGTSGDLFRVPDVVFPALVRVIAGNESVESSVIVRQNRAVIAIPPNSVTEGTTFGFPLGDVGNGALVLIAAPGADAQVMLRIGNAPEQPPVFLASGQVMQVRIDQPNVRVNVRSANNVNLLVQLVVYGRGKDIAITHVLPGG